MFRNDYSLDMSKRYYVFLYPSYNPEGGLNDLVYTGDDLGMLMDRLQIELTRSSDSRCDIFDMTLRKVIYHSVLRSGKLFEEVWDL